MHEFAIEKVSQTSNQVAGIVSKHHICSKLCYTVDVQESFVDIHDILVLIELLVCDNILLIDPYCNHPSQSIVQNEQDQTYRETDALQIAQILHICIHKLRMLIYSLSHQISGIQQRVTKRRFGLDIELHRHWLPSFDPPWLLLWVDCLELTARPPRSRWHS